MVRAHRLDRMWGDAAVKVAWLKMGSRLGSKRPRRTRNEISLTENAPCEGISVASRGRARRRTGSTPDWLDAGLDPRRCGVHRHLNVGETSEMNVSAHPSRHGEAAPGLLLQLLEVRAREPRRAL